MKRQEQRYEKDTWMYMCVHRFFAHQQLPASKTNEGLDVKPHGAGSLGQHGVLSSSSLAIYFFIIYVLNGFQSRNLPVYAWQKSCLSLEKKQHGC